MTRRGNSSSAAVIFCLTLAACNPSASPKDDTSQAPAATASPSQAAAATPVSAAPTGSPPSAARPAPMPPAKEARKPPKFPYEAPARSKGDWAFVEVSQGPTAAAALLGSLLRDLGKGNFANATKCVAVRDGALSEAEMAFLRTKSRAVERADRCAMADHGGVRDTVTKETAIIVHVRRTKALGADGGEFDGGQTYGNLGGEGRNYRVTRSAGGWRIEQGFIMWIS